MAEHDISGYHYTDTILSHSHDYLLPSVLRVLDKVDLPVGEKRLFELVYGNGSAARVLTRSGWDVIGVDPSSEGIAQAREGHPDLGSTYDDLVGQYGQFPVLLSLEVVEHLFAPRHYARTLFELTAKGGGNHCLDPLSRLLEEPCTLGEWSHG